MFMATHNVLRRRFTRRQPCQETGRAAPLRTAQPGGLPYAPAMRLIVPADYFSPTQPDAQYAGEAAAFAALGWSVSTLDEDGRLRPAAEAGDTALYRGWMLDAAGYAALEAAVRATGAELLTSAAQYLGAHHLPNWLPLLADLTPETICFTELDTAETRLRALGWDRFFMKDHVKSLKTGGGSLIERPEQIRTLLAEMAHFRGQIEGGLCVRRFEVFMPSTERRYFVVGGQPASADGSSVPEIVWTCAGRLALPFFSVDVAMRKDGALRIVEVGDGQVSDLVGWNVEQFVALWG